MTSTKTTALHKSSIPLPPDARGQIAAALNAVLADGVDLLYQVKVAHWNIRGPLFPSLHPFFDTIVTAAFNTNDEVAERAVKLGAQANGLIRNAAKVSRLPDYPPGLSRDLDHVKALVERVEKYILGVREARDVADSHKDPDTVDLLTKVVEQFDTFAWMLRATCDA